MNKSTLFITSLSFLLITNLVGCRAEELGETDAGSDQQSDALESAITVISGQADDATGESFALQKSATDWKVALVESILLPSATATNCGRAFSQVCNNAAGTKTATYSSCDVGSRGFLLTGSVTLTYSNNSCSLGVGESVVRTFDHTISGPHGGAIQTTSALRTNYRGTQLGGGGRLSHLSLTTWEMELLGKHKIGTRNGHALFDVSVQTTNPLVIDGTLSRSGRTISAGSVEVSHNLAQFSAVYAVTQPLVWNSTCCHPVSGAMSATYSGSLSGQGTITFNGCGSPQLSKDGRTRTLSIGYCE